MPLRSGGIKNHVHKASHFIQAVEYLRGMELESPTEAAWCEALQEFYALIHTVGGVAARDWAAEKRC